MKSPTSIANVMRLCSLAMAIALLCTPRIGRCQTALACGQTVTNTTTSATQIDQYTIAVTAGDKLTLALWGPISCNSDYMVADIYGPDGQQVASLSSGCSVGAALNLNFTNTGFYTIFVHESYYRATATYFLSLQSRTGGGCNGSPIACGQTVTTNTSAYTQMHGYSYAGTAGETLVLALWGPISCNSDYMVADIYGPAGQYVASLSSGCSVGAALGLTLTNTGIHTILVRESYYRSTATYSLSLQSRTAGGCNGRAITCGQTVTTNTSAYTQMHSYSYAGTAGETLVLALWGPISCNSDYMVADIYGPAGQYVTSLSSGCSVGAALGLTLTNTGTYTILVHESYYRSTAAYSLSLQSRTAGGCNGSPITCGQTVTTNTSAYTQMHSYSYAGTAGETLVLALWGPISCNSDYMVADIYGPAGQYVTSLSSGCSVGAALGLTLTNTGTYTILVHESYYRATAPYSLSLQSRTAGGCNGRAIVCGQTVTTNTSAYTQMHSYSYDGTTGETLALALYGPISCNSDYMVADIYGPAGQYVASFSSGCSVGAALNLTLTNTGTFTILVHESYYRATAAYSLSLQSRSGGGCNETALVCGRTLNAEIRRPSEMRSHLMFGSAGERVILSASGFAGMVVDLYDPNGTSLASIGPSGTANLTLAVTGSYTLLVHAGNYGGTGMYGLTLTVFGGCTESYLGSEVVRTQQVACLPLRIVAPSPAIWVSFMVKAPPGLLSSPTVSATAQFTNVAVTPVTEAQWLVTLQTSPAHGVIGDQIIGSLCFTAISTQSVFAPILLSNLVVTNQGGMVPGAAAFGGRLVIIADQPLLEAWRSTNGQRMVTLYGKANTNYEIQETANPAGAGAWIPGWTNTVPASLLIHTPAAGALSTAPVQFLRALER